MRAGQIGTYGIDDPLALWNTLNMSYIVIRVLNHRLMNHWHPILLRPDNKTNTTLIVWVWLLTLGGGGKSLMV